MLKPAKKIVVVTYVSLQGRKGTERYRIELIVKLGSSFEGQCFTFRSVESKGNAIEWATQPTRQPTQISRLINTDFTNFYVAF